MTAAELKTMRELAGGLRLSEYARALLLSPRKRLKVVPAISSEQWSALAPLASNLNQLAHHLNAGRAVASSDLEATVEQLQQQLAEIRLALLGVEESGDS